jgi:endonuclease YncB( thermonuclease family)
MRNLVFTLVLLGLIGPLLDQQLLSSLSRQPVLALACGAIAILLPVWHWRYFLWHSFANATAFEAPKPLVRPWIIDGDTIDDRAIGVRYRLANIDAPETGDNAKCYNERRRGELATGAAIRLVRAARSVTVRRTWRTDRYGRRVAFVLVDGEDLGSALVQLGLAHPWRGSRERWCGPRGGLARISRTGGQAFACQACRRWRS